MNTPEGTLNYTYGLQRISENQQIQGAWTPSFYGYDGFGSVRQLTNASATVTDTYNYDAFGNLLNSTGTTPNSYLYRGEQYDTNLNLYYLRARYYNPQTDRFMSRDPEDGITIDPKTLHKYVYAGGDPVNAMDPRGRALVEEEEIDLSKVQEWEVETGPTSLAKRLIACFMTIYDALYMTVNHGWSAWGAGQDGVGLYFCIWP